MITFKVSGIKENRKVFMYVVAKDFIEAINLSTSAKLKGTERLKRLDKILKMEIVEEDTVIKK